MTAQTQRYSAIWNFALQDSAQRTVHHILQQHLSTQNLVKITSFHHGCIFTEQYQRSCLDFFQTKFTENVNSFESLSREQRWCDENLNWKNLLPLLVLHRISLFTVCQTLMSRRAHLPLLKSLHPHSLWNITCFAINRDSGVICQQNLLYGGSSNKMRHHLNSFTHLLEGFWPFFCEAIELAHKTKF